MDLVFPYKRRSSEDELRYSLRSAAANLSFEKVVIVGDKPRTIKPDLFIKYRGANGRYDNTCSKLLEAARSPEVSEEFVLMNDDFFIMRKFHKFPYLFSKLLDDWLASYEHRKGNYYRCAERTRAALKPGARFFGLHCPMILDKGRLLELAGRFRLPRNMMLRTLYGSYYNVEARQCEDRKAKDGDEIAKYAGGDWFSTADAAARTRNFHELMTARFPQPSRFEMAG